MHESRDVGIKTSSSEFLSLVVSMIVLLYFRTQTPKKEMILLCCHRLLREFSISVFKEMRDQIATP